jgi:hypothetical protein
VYIRRGGTRCNCFSSSFIRHFKASKTDINQSINPQSTSNHTSAKHKPNHPTLSTACSSSVPPASASQPLRLPRLRAPLPPPRAPLLLLFSNRHASRGKSSPSLKTTGPTRPSGRLELPGALKRSVRSRIRTLPSSQPMMDGADMVMRVESQSPDARRLAEEVMDWIGIKIYFSASSIIA